MNLNLSYTADASLENLGGFRDFVERGCRQVGLDDAVIYGLKLAVDEVCTNIITHGFEGMQPQPIAIGFEATQDQVTITISDVGRAFNPLEAAPPDLQADWKERKIGGLGLYFLRRMIDDIRYHTDQDRVNHLTMIKWIKPRNGEAD